MTTTNETFNAPVLIPKYKPLFTRPKSRYFLLTGGRGSAKSFHVNYFLLWLIHQPNHVILFTRWTMVSAHISIIPEFTEKIERMGKLDEFIINKTDITYIPTGSTIIFRGIKTSQGTATANLKSLPNVTTWVLEEGEELQDPEIFDKIDLSIRSKKQPNRIIVLMNPSFKTHFIWQRFFEKGFRKDTTYIHTSYLDNIVNLPDSYIAQAERMKQQNPIRFEHIFMGEWLEAKTGLLWNKEMIDRLRVDRKPDFVRTIVAIDPATTATMESDETGIVVQGKTENGKIYVIDDLSGKYSPNEWATVAIEAVKKYNCDCVVAEKNQGGDMVKSVIRQVDKVVRIKLVTATKGKYIRAEPVYSLYEQNIVFHVGRFPILENQMITFDPDSGNSPDRVDALVWGVHELGMKNDSGDFIVSDGKIIRGFSETDENDEIALLPKNKYFNPKLEVDKYIIDDDEYFDPEM